MKQEVTKAPKERNKVTFVEPIKQDLTWWSRLTPEQRKLISNIAIWSGISLAALATIYFGSKIIKNKISHHEQGKSFGGDKWATWADKIHNALNNDGFYFGTDEQMIRKVLIEIPSKRDFELVKKSFKKQFKKNMAEAIRGDLSTSEYEEMLAIINSKPEKAKDGAPIYDPLGWAKRLNAAFNYRMAGWFWGTDEDAITAVIVEMPTQQAYLDTAEAYLDQYGVSLMTDVRGDLSTAEIANFTKLIRQKPIR